MAELIPFPYVGRHRISYTSNHADPPSYKANCLCGWESDNWNRDYMKVERTAKAHLKAATR